MSISVQNINALERFRAQVRRNAKEAVKMSLPGWKVKRLLLLSCQQHGAYIKPKHWPLFVNRQYGHAEEVDRAVRRYKVFGDLGFGAR